MPVWNPTSEDGATNVWCATTTTCAERVVIPRRFQGDIPSIMPCNASLLAPIWVNILLNEIIFFVWPPFFCYRTILRGRSHRTRSGPVFHLSLLRRDGSFRSWFGWTCWRQTSKFHQWCGTLTNFLFLYVGRNVFFLKLWPVIKQIMFVLATSSGAVERFTKELTCATRSKRSFSETENIACFCKPCLEFFF